MLSSPQLEYLKILLGARLDRSRLSERGASAVEWVVITACLVAIAGIVYYAISAAVSQKSSEINLDP